MNNQIEDFIIHFLERKETPEDIQKLKDWLATDPAHRDELKQWLAAWDTAGVMEVVEKIDPDKAYQRFMFRMGAEDKETTPKSPAKVVRMDIFPTIRRIAAIFLISFSLGILSHYYWAKDQPEQIAYIENIVPLGSKSEVKLPDGSTISLNAGTTLRYPTDYGKTKRDVHLTGEAYFNVAKQNGKPFTVHTPLANVTALGTEFNVKAYPDEDMVETTLIRGKVAVEKGEASHDYDRIVLQPGQKLSVTSTDAQPILVGLDPDIAEAEVSWKEKSWRNEGIPLQDLAVKLERRYDVRIRLDEQSKNYRFSGTFRDETLEQVLHIIQLSIPIRFHIDGKTVEISIDPKKVK
jgi:ferric-dicitrate binding protein FerR (iron transport regulator)